MSNEFSSFYNEVKSIEKQDSKYTSEEQLKRLLRPGSTYSNLNPFEVLMVDPDDPNYLEAVKKQYKKLSILLHPDKNPNDAERAQKAFDAINKAFKMLDDEKTRAKILEVVEEARYKVKKEMEEKRRKHGGRIEEDNPEKQKQSIRVMTMKLFAEYERKRRLMEEKAQEERKRQREEEIEEEKAKELEREYQKDFDESREQRVANWHNFTKKAKFKRKDIRPPKHKAETPRH